MSSLEGFAKRMRMRGNNVPSQVNKVKRLGALAVDQAIVLATPVDTGTARSNWVVTLSEAASGTIDAYFPLEGGGIDETANAQAALAQAKAVIARAQPGQDIHITNNMSYIVSLNEGSSEQAPAAFVEEAVNAGINAIRTSRFNTGKRG